MDKRQAHWLTTQLYFEFPLLGGWWRRRAAQELAQDGTANALIVLAQALYLHWDKRVLEIARQAILKADTPGCIDAICKAWTEKRHAWLAQLIRERGWVAVQPPAVRVLSALQAGQSDVLLDEDARVVTALVDACRDQDAHIAQQALNCLPNLCRPSGIDALCARWAESRAAFLETAMLQGGYVARRPAALRILTALKAGKVEVARHARVDAVQHLIQAAGDQDPAIAGLAQQALSALERSEARDEVCRLVIEQEHPVALQAAQQGEYAPSDPYQRALFFFLTGQWAEYQALDFDQRVLRTAYEGASPAQRQRLLEKMRASGQANLLEAITTRQVIVHTPQEASFLVQLLAEQGQWERLWAKVFEFPFAASAQILRTLAGQSWRPEREDERAALEELIKLASADIETTGQAMRSLLPPAVLRAHASLQAGRINTLAFSPTRPVIAVGASTRKVVVWDFQRGQRQEVLEGFEHSIGQVAFSGDGRLLFAERTNSQELCSTYLHQPGGAIRVWQQPGSVTDLEPAGETQVLIAGRDHNVILLDLDGLSKVAGSTRLNSWARAVRLAPDGGSVAVLHYGLDLLNLPGFNPLFTSRENFWKAGVLRCASFAPGGQGLVVGNAAGVVYALSKPFAEHSPARFTRHKDRIQGIEALEGSGVVVSADASGEVHFTGWAKDRLPVMIQSPGQQTNSLHISPDGAFMALGDSDASLSLWDLRVLDVPDLLDMPLARSTPNYLAVVNTLLESDSMPGLPVTVRNTLAVMERLLRYRFRFDIEVSEAPRIKAGEWDIEIDGRDE